ncbi:hypothetical protein [Longicatena caecimuris]|uniref:Uncharacterized protein n=1 Tax=Longicatena caecimuris TaxID=1796635 RepID=A0A4R3TML2_9FIRM|nr:hypothetical protein [Longicatena caecimuris]MCR1868963.1 hypothetical protein [Longicatena caecimuris]MCR1868972.1 hypothetical protein [Longicatena caecimuris]MCU0101453.1 hypothetical protein [Longicatena caecimuris]MCU0101462.1 hypothetical protein [Longicatena caecimuris]TCU63496.1 hypothetical protein EDD61_101148 [Longicatena caecimuris]
MILELLFTPIFGIIDGLISLIPVGSSMPGWAQDTANLLGIAMMFFPADVWAVCLANISLWQFGHIGWAVIEWIYKKIPGVD